MKPGDRIRITEYIHGHAVGNNDYTVEEFRYCLGVFMSEQARKAEHFTPLCELYEPGPESKNGYISNYGEYHTNMVQGWMDLPRENVKR